MTKYEELKKAHTEYYEQINSFREKCVAKVDSEWKDIESEEELKSITLESIRYNNAVLLLETGKVIFKFEMDANDDMHEYQVTLTKDELEMSNEDFEAYLKISDKHK